MDSPGPSDAPELRALGARGPEVYPLALGANTFDWTASPEVSAAILDAYTAAGGNFIDTADSYSAWAPGHVGGESETVIGDWLAGRSGGPQLVIATKVSRHPRRRGLAPDTIRAAAEESLARLRSERIDLYFAHYDDPDTPILESARAFDELVREGLVSHIGLSNYSPARVEEWCATCEREGLTLPVALQPHYNLMVRREFEQQLWPVIESRGLGVTPYYGLAAGFLTGKYRSAADADGEARERMVSTYLTPAGFAVLDELEAVAGETGTVAATVALAWLRVQPGVTAPIASASRLSQVPALLESASLELSDDQVARLSRATDGFGG